jgi:uncharacterized metal-binding protein
MRRSHENKTNIQDSNRKKKKITSKAGNAIGSASSAKPIVICPGCTFCCGTKDWKLERDLASTSSQFKWGSNFIK